MPWTLTLLSVLAWHQEIDHTEVERELRTIIGDIDIQMQAQAAGHKEETAVLDEVATRWPCFSKLASFEWPQEGSDQDRRSPRPGKSTNGLNVRFWTSTSRYPRIVS